MTEDLIYCANCKKYINESEILTHNCFITNYEKPLKFNQEEE